jgi:hypothetical protein
MKRLRIVAMLVLTFLVMTSALARAVDVGITDGFLGVPHVTDLAHPFDLIGADFRFTGGRSDFAGEYLLTTFANGAVGTMADLDGFFAVGLGNTLTYRGETSTFLGGSLNFSTPTVPTRAAGSTPSSFLVTAPFTMTGSITTHSDRLATTPALETFNLMGQGTATASFQGSPDSFWMFRGATFTFEAPGIGNGGPVIPEPSTVLLVASGLAGLGLWRRRSAA